MQYDDKSDTFEEFLQRLNGALLGEFGMPSAVTDPRLLSGQIVGLPRSGTTLLYQLLARTRAVGYPSNILALFWEVPIVGAQLQQQLAANDPTLSLHSLAGRTSEPLDPHEFGYFWRAALGHGSNTTVVDRDPWPWDRLQVTLDAIANVFGTPVVYKNFLVLAHVEELRSRLKRQRYLVLDRPLIDIAASLLSVRRNIGIDDRADFGLTVRSDTKQRGTLVERVARQVSDLDRLKRSCDFASDPDALSISYSELCVEPRAVITHALEFLDADSTRVSDVIPSRLQVGGGASNLEDCELNTLRDALEVELS